MWNNLCLINSSNTAYHYTIFSHMQVAELTREWVGKWKDIQRIIQVLAEDLLLLESSLPLIGASLSERQTV